MSELAPSEVVELRSLRATTEHMSVIEEAQLPPSQWLVEHIDKVPWAWLGRRACLSNAYKIGRQN